MAKDKLFSASLLLGIALGIMSARYFLIGSWLNLALWAVAALALGFLARAKQESMAAGGIYGFFLTISFLAAGFRGSPDRLPGFIVFSLVLSIAGFGCGLVWAYIGHALKKIH